MTKIALAVGLLLNIHQSISSEVNTRITPPITIPSHIGALATVSKLANGTELASYTVPTSIGNTIDCIISRLDSTDGLTEYREHFSSNITYIHETALIKNIFRDLPANTTGIVFDIIAQHKLSHLETKSIKSPQVKIVSSFLDLDYHDLNTIFVLHMNNSEFMLFIKQFCQFALQTEYKDKKIHFVNISKQKQNKGYNTAPLPRKHKQQAIKEPPKSEPASPRDTIDDELFHFEADQ